MPGPSSGDSSSLLCIDALTDVILVLITFNTTLNSANYDSELFQSLNGAIVGLLYSIISILFTA